MKPVVLLFFVISISINSFSQWTQTSGPDGAKSHEVFYVENYLFVNGYNGGVYRSADKGLTWESVNNGLPVDFRCYTMDVEDNKLYIGTSNGVYFSDNLGDSWQLLTSADLYAYSLEVSGDEIFVGSADNVAIQYSPDGGATWEQKYGSQRARHILKFGNTLWVGTGSKLCSSPDNGTTWRPSNLDIIVSSLDSADGDLFISGNDQYGFFGVYRSADNGSSWIQILSTQETNIPSSGFLKLGNTVYVLGFTSLYYSDDNGTTWTTSLLPHSYNFYQETFMTHIDSELFVSFGDGILSTADRGETWEQRNISYKNHSIIQLAKTNQSIACYSEFNGVYVSKDNGDNWKWIPDHDAYRPRQIYAYDNVIVVSYLLGIYRSDDEGETWQKIFTLTDDISGTHAIPDVHLTGWKDSLIFCTYKGVYFSTDMGTSWDLKPVSTFDTDAYIFKSFFQRDTVVLLTQKEFFYSIDFGKTWQKREIPGGLPSSYYSVTDMLFSKSDMTMSTQFGLYKSTDLGITWKRNDCIPDPNIYDMELVDQTLVIATYTGVYASQNGVDWYAVHDGLQNARTMAIAISGQLSFVGTWGKSVWKRPLADLLTPGKILVDADEVPKPLIEGTCSAVTVVNAAQQFLIKWYKDGVLIPNENGIKLQTTGAGIYQASFENNCDLKTSDEMSVGNTKNPDPEIYNVMTVNGDGKNDYYFVDAGLIGSRLNIYNRWGEIIYSNASYENDWSPTEIAGGLYFYAIESKCLGTFKGVLTILKP